MIKHYLPWLRNEALEFALDCFCFFVFIYIATLWLVG